MRCLTVFAIFMWLLFVSRSSDYWLGIFHGETPRALVDVKVCLGIPSCVPRWVTRGSRGLILGSTGRGRPILGSTGRGPPPVVSRQCFPNILRVSNLLCTCTSSALEATYAYKVRPLCVSDLCFKVFLVL